jgi:shikimate dehydrogenase
MNQHGTCRTGLIGWPVEHSVSPTMLNAAYESLELDWCYEPLPTEPGRVAERVAWLRQEGYRGANVTLPHKRAVMLHLDELTTAAQEIGAVNTLVEREGQWIGDNTDAAGFVEALVHAGVEVLGNCAVVVGAGGGARAAVYGLLEEGAERVVVLNRSAGRAESLAYDLDCCEGGVGRIELLGLSREALVRSVDRAALLVNATPVGQWPQIGDSIWPEGVLIPPYLAVLDLVYNPYETRLLRQARASGARPISGLEMLVRQGAQAFELWTGERAPVAVMREAAFAALHRQEAPVVV